MEFELWPTQAEGAPYKHHQLPEALGSTKACLAAGKELKWLFFSSNVPVTIVPEDCAPKIRPSPPFWTANGILKSCSITACYQTAGTVCWVSAGLQSHPAWI